MRNCRYKIDKEKKYIEITYRLINYDEFFRIIDSINEDINGWTIHFNFDKNNEEIWLNVATVIK